MKRIKKHKVKKERAETSAYDRVLQEHDLAYYIHDRVELMHQVFSVLKAKDLRAMAPESVRRLSIDDLQELCTEELLGISSKRLCATLDGAEPPSDTESSSRSRSHSPVAMETISLDSISSDEEILSQSSRKKKKHKREPKSKRAKKPKPSDTQPPPIEVDQSRASRAGLTVLELLELQARARAIRAQLQQEQAKKAAEASSEPVKVDDDDDEVEIKEEQPEVVVLSSDDEKPNLSMLEKEITTKNKQAEPTVNGKDSAKDKQKSLEMNKEPAKKKEKTKKKKKDKQKERIESTSEATEKSVELNKSNDAVTSNNETVKPNETQTQTITKRVNDLVITVPQPQKSTRKIKLNRNKVTVSVNTTASAGERSVTGDVSVTVEPTRINSVVTKPPDRLSSVVNKPKVVETTVTTPSVRSVVVVEAKDVGKKKEKVKKVKRKERKSFEEDHDEIMLQLSDTEKMDLLEDFDRKNYDNVSSSTESSSDDTESNDESNRVENSMEKVASPVFANKADMMKDGTLAIEVINDNFYRGIEDLDQETEKNYTNIEKSQEMETGQENKKGDGKDDEIDQESERRDGIDRESETRDEIGQQSERGDANITENDVTQDETSDSESDSSENDSEHETPENGVLNSDRKDINPKTSDVNRITDETMNEIQESVAINTTANESQQKKGESAIETDKTSENLAYVSIDKDDTRDNIEICKIDDIPVIDDESKKIDEVSIENEAPDQEMTHEKPVQGTENEPMQETYTDITEVEYNNQELVDVPQNETSTDIELNTQKKCNVTNKLTDNGKVRDEIEDVSDQQDKKKNKEKSEEKDQQLSEGEVSSNESSEVEAFELKPEVVCISDEEEKTSVKKKKKKDKKSKKEKKSKKKKSDFRESADENFYTETISNVAREEILFIGDTKDVTSNKESDTISLDSNDDIYEILELSDDSSCYEVEGTVLSKEPTAEEIAALSAKIDEIDSSCYIVEDTVLSKEPTAEEIAALEEKVEEIDERDEAVTEEQISEHERMLKLAVEKRDVDQETEEKKEDVAKENVVTKEFDKSESEYIENISWKDRYLDSTKVKKVLKSSNILNALRKKNKELKKKMEESRKKEAEELALKLQEAKKKQEELENKQKLLEEGSIEHYNTLQGSTKYVDPVQDPTEKPVADAQKDTEDTQNTTVATAEEARMKSVEIEVTGEMKKDAKQLLKIYKKLLKYNDITKQRDPNKVKKKKKKTKKKDGGTVVCAANV